MYIDDILISKDISIRELTGKGYNVHHGLRTTRIKTAPQTVLFLQQEFLTDLLKKSLGLPDMKNENGWVYLFPEYNITCQKEPHGKRQYEGGNIIIEFCRSGMRDADPKDVFS